MTIRWWVRHGTGFGPLFHFRDEPLLPVLRVDFCPAHSLAKVSITTPGDR